MLTTPRLILRRFRDSDAETFAGYRSDPVVARYQSWDTPFPVDAARAFVHEQAVADPARSGWFQYAIESRSDGGLVGDVGVHLHENRMQAEIGFTLAAAHQGHGYATEAVGRVLTELFTVAGLVRVSAECDARNDRSARLLARLGFRREGLRVRNTWTKGEWTDDLLFGLLAEDWRAGYESAPGSAAME